MVTTNREPPSSSIGDLPQSFDLDFLNQEEYTVTGRSRERLKREAEAYWLRRMYGYPLKK